MKRFRSWTHAIRINTHAILGHELGTKLPKYLLQLAAIPFGNLELSLVLDHARQLVAASFAGGPVRLHVARGRGGAEFHFDEPIHLLHVEQCRDLAVLLEIEEVVHLVVQRVHLLHELALLLLLLGLPKNCVVESLRTRMGKK